MLQPSASPSVIYNTATAYIGKTTGKHTLKHKPASQIDASNFPRAVWESDYSFPKNVTARS